MAATTLPPAVRAELTDVLGASHVLTDPELVAPHVVDWTGRFVGSTGAVLRPGSVEEVAAVVAACRRHGVAMVPQGGNTGLVGGSVPLEGEVVLSLRRLDHLGEVEPLDGQVDVGAGCTLAQLAAHVAPLGLRPPVDLAARGSATLGGMVATNAGGLHVVRHGAMRHHLTGHEAVLGDGGVVRHLAGLAKDNTGYDLGGLLCGSEGTLGVLTRVRVRLLPEPQHVATALVAFTDVPAAVAAVAAWRRAVPELEAAELVLDDGVELVREVTGAALPFERRAPAYVLVEAAGPTDPTDALGEAVAGVPGVVDAAVATDGPGRARLWQLREDHTTAIATLGAPHKLDVGLPLSAVAPFLERVRATVSSIAPDARTWLFGHVGDGNVHVNVTGVDPDDDRVDEAVLLLTAELGGSISAEHGIGRAKQRWLHLNRSPAELAAFRALKAALDPDGVLNPGVLLPGP